MVRIDNDTLHNLLEEAKVTRVISNDLGAVFLQLANNLLGKARYRGYPPETRDDLVYNSMIPICKYCFSYDASKATGKTPAFSYCTRIIEMNFWGTLNKYYKKSGDDNNSEEDDIEAFNWWFNNNEDTVNDEKLTEVYDAASKIVNKMSVQDRQIASILWGFGSIEDMDDDSVTDKDIRKNRQRIWRTIKKELAIVFKV